MDLSKRTYLDSLRTDSDTIAGCARPGMDVPVLSCPGWTLATLVGHLGRIYVSVAQYVSGGTNRDVVRDLAELGLPPDIEEWFVRDLAPEAAPPIAVDWFERAAGEVGSALGKADPGDYAWSWMPGQQTAGFWTRRLAHETAIHRWDAQLARGHTQPIERGIAEDGIIEVLMLRSQSDRGRRLSPIKGTGETYLFQQTDGSGEWTVRFPGSSMDVIEGGIADITIRGSASDLMLFLWQRIPADSLEVRGDRALVPRWFELVPPV